MEILISTFCDLLHILKFIVLFDCFFLFEKRNLKSGKVVVFILGVIFSLIIYYKDNTDLGMLVYFIFIVIAMNILYKEKVGRITLMCLGLLCFISLIDQMSGVLIQTILCITTLYSINTFTISTNVLTLLVLIIVGKIMKCRNNRGIMGIGKIYLFLFFILIVIDASVLVYLSGFVLEKIQTERRASLGFVFILVVLGVFIQMAMVILLLMSRNVYKEKEALAAKYLKEQEAHYTYLERREKETKNFRHDLREHLHVLNVLCNNHNYTEFQEYLRTMNGKIEEFGMKISVNNGFVDAILNKYAVEAEEKNIKLKVSGHFPTDCKIEPYDLCTIVSNLLSNAIEAEYKWGGTEVEVFCRYTESEVVLVIENDYDGGICYENGKLTTSKKDKINHGFGLENVEKSVNNNSGFMDITTENHKFKVSVIFEKG